MIYVRIIFIFVLYKIKHCLNKISENKIMFYGIFCAENWLLKFARYMLFKQTGYTMRAPKIVLKTYADSS